MTQTWKNSKTRMKDHARAHFCAQKNTRLLPSIKKIQIHFIEIFLSQTDCGVSQEMAGILSGENRVLVALNITAPILCSKTTVLKKMRKKKKRSSQETAPEIKEIEVVKSCSMKL